MAWTNLVAAVALSALGIYLLRRAPDLTQAEVDLFHYSRWYGKLRVWSYRLGGAFLLACAVGMLVGGVE